MSKFSVEARDIYLYGLESITGSEVIIDLEQPDGQPGQLKELKAFITDETPDGTYEQDKFTFVKNGRLVTISAPHVYRRFLNGERSPRPMRDIPTVEALRELHPDILDKSKDVKIRAEKPPRERKMREPKAKKEGHTSRKARGPKPVETEAAEPVAV